MAKNARCEMGDAIAAPRATVDTSAAGAMSYYSDTSVSGRPLLLLHSINAAPSAFEVQPLFEVFRRRRPVFAPDLPGFGFSERADIDYSPALYAEALTEFSQRVIGEACDALALSTTSEFLARAAVDAPGRFTSLALISPTGLSERPPPSATTSKRLQRAFGLPLLGEGLYRLLTSRASIRYFLNLNFRGEVPVELVDYAYATAHQPKARYAPYRFLSMALFTRDVASDVYARVASPTLVIYDRDPNVSFEKLDGLLAENSLWQARRITPTLGLPHWEQPGKTVAALEQFWEEADV
jgi:pimeloyl-ACP methyl ester carboxylesterase